MTSAIEEVDFLARSEHRVDALRRLRDGPADRDDLERATGASRATVARLANEFEDRNWVVRDGPRYALSDLGEFVADEFLRLVDRMETERTLRDVWKWVPSEMSGCSPSLFVDAAISLPESHSPYHPIPRFVELVESAGTMRGFSERSLKPGSYEVILRNAAEGMETELAFPRAVIDEMLVVVPRDVIEAALEGPRLVILEHEELPSDAGFALFDDRLALYCRDDDGVTKVGVDTDRAEAVAWGESVYEDVRSGARTVDVAKRST